jgi:hypothetical protein
MEVPDWTPPIENTMASKLVTPLDNGKFKIDTIGGVSCLKVCLDDVRKGKDRYGFEYDLPWTLKSCFKRLLENGCSTDSLDDEIKGNSRAKEIIDELFPNGIEQ